MTRKPTPVELAEDHLLEAVLEYFYVPWWNAIAKLRWWFVIRRFHETLITALELAEWEEFSK